MGSIQRGGRMRSAGRSWPGAERMFIATDTVVRDRAAGSITDLFNPDGDRAWLRGQRGDGFDGMIPPFGAPLREAVSPRCCDGPQGCDRWRRLSTATMARSRHRVGADRPWGATF